MATATPPATPAETAVKGFFGSLFDFSFKHFVSRRLAGIFYGVGLVVIAIAAIVGLIVGIGGGFATMATQFGGGGIAAGIFAILGTIVVVPIGTLISIIVLRVWIEAVVALVAVAENTASLRK
jgi:hypothetical protein